MSTEPKVVSTQTTITSTTVSSDFKQQAQTPDHKTYVTEIKKELTEASTATHNWSPGHNGHLMVNIFFRNVLIMNEYQIIFFL